MNRTAENYYFLKSLKNKDELMFRCALDNIINKGLEYYKSKSIIDIENDIDLISEQYQKDEKNLPLNCYMGYTLDFAIEIYKTTLLIAQKAEPIDLQICVSNMSFFTPDIQEVQNYQKADMFDDILEKSIDEYFNENIEKSVVFETISEYGLSEDFDIENICEDLYIL